MLWQKIFLHVFDTITVSRLQKDFLIMLIQNNYNKSPNFGVKLNTGKVLETTTLKIFQSVGMDGCRDVIKALNDRPIKATGCRGYRYYAEKIGKQITEKYPAIKAATEEIKSIVARQPDIKKSELNEKIRPIIERLGAETDITL